jgi:hypothetical protein
MNALAVRRGGYEGESEALTAMECPNASGWCWHIVWLTEERREVRKEKVVVGEDKARVESPERATRSGLRWCRCTCSKVELLRNIRRRDSGSPLLRK